MVAAAFLLIVSAIGVGFGYQPMPGDESRSELQVQIAPEMLQRLARGESIPLTTDVPAEAGKVARVRLVIGSEPLPQRQVVTRLKPTGESATAESGADSGILLTQYTQPESPRYGAPANGVTPTFDPYTQVPPTTNPAADTAWNADPAAANALRTPAPVVPTLTSDNSWNATAAPAVAPVAAPTGPLRRLGEGIQDATQPIQDGINNVGNRLQTATQNLAGRTDQLIDELGRPLQGGLLGGRSNGTATPAAGTSATSAPVWNGGAAAPPFTPTTPPLASGTAGAAASEPTSAWNGGGDAASDAGAAPQYNPPYGAPAATTSTTAANADPWANPGDPRLSSNAGGSPTAPGTSGWPGSGTLSLPEPPPLTTAGAASGGPLLTSPGNTPTTPGIPAISTGLFNLPGDRPLEGGSTSLGASPATAPGLGGLGSATGNPATPGAAPNAAGGSILSSPGWPALVTPQTTTPAAATLPTTAAATAPASDPGRQAMVLFAWVTLFGSIAGNIYLFWSYLDVRTKYRSLVRKTARAVGSRFSAA